MTEDQAKTKWCPFYRATEKGMDNRLSVRNGAGEACCIGAACMAWRWDRSLTDTDSDKSFTSGYCGLAGR